MQVEDSDANRQPRGGPRPELSAHAARCAPRRGACEHGQCCTGPRTPVPTRAQAPMLLEQEHHTPQVLSSPGMGSRSPPLRVGVLYSWLWSPRPPPPTSNHHTPFLLFFAERLPHTRPLSSSWNTPLGAMTPWGAFLPPFEGAPCLSLPRSPLASRQPHAQLVMDGQAGHLGAPALAPGPLASPPHLPGLRSPAQLQELSCPHGSSTGQRFSCGMRGAQPSRQRPCFCR